MLSDTLATGLEQYRIGAKIKALRGAKKLGLVQLGEHTGLSAGMLSKIERGQLFPTLPTLLRIAMVFGVGLEHFFVETQARRPVAVIRRSERIKLPSAPGEASPPYFFESISFPVTDRQMDAYLADFPAAGEASPPHAHDGSELIYVIAGSIAIDIDGITYALDEGDAAYFDSEAPHSYRNPGAAEARAVVVTTRQPP